MGKVILGYIYAKRTSRASLEASLSNLLYKIPLENLVVRTLNLLKKHCIVWLMMEIIRTCNIERIF